jgi:hypothetical protein
LATLPGKAQQRQAMPGMKRHLVPRCLATASGKARSDNGHIVRFAGRDRAGIAVADDLCRGLS